jgi:hypothetical protein
MSLPLQSMHDTHALAVMEAPSPAFALLRLLFLSTRHNHYFIEFDEVALARRPHPNTAVKLLSADGTAQSGRVGRCLIFTSKPS